MTLSDINDLCIEVRACESVNDALQLFYDAGEDADENTVKVIFELCKDCELYKNFSYADASCFIYEREIKCIKCKNTSPNTLIASASEILSLANEVHFGCCECGTQFTINKNNGK